MKKGLKLILLIACLPLITLAVYLIKSKFQSTPNINEVSSPSLIEQSMTPFWQGNTIFNESMLLVSYNNGQPESPFLFPYVNIISVQNSALNKTYTPGIDWMFKDNKLILPTGSSIPFVHDSEIGSPNFSTPLDYFHSKQISVTYTHSGKWLGPIPRYSPDLLPETIQKLDSGTPIKITLFGDSISVGYNTSGLLNIPPYLPSWGDLLVKTLSSKYASPITYSNPSVAGKDTAWGLANVDTLVSVNIPDLVVLAFGMNDGAIKIPTEVYKANISSMINNIKSKSPKAEIILVSPMLGFPGSNFAGFQSSYGLALKSLVKTGVVYVDMAAVHLELLKVKKYADLTGNNINHPNDFLSRWYAQETVGILIAPTVAELNMKPVKGTTDKNTIYLIENGTKRSYPNETLFLASFSHADVIQLSDKTLADIPSGKNMGDNTPLSKSGDLNNDGKVNLYDYTKLIQGFGTVYSDDDFVAVLANYGK